MPVLFLYLFKLSVALSAVYLFYQGILRRLTFYNCNRWYLLGYSFLAFFIAFINISPVLEKNDWASVSIVNWVTPIHVTPAIQGPAIMNTGISSWDWAITVFFSGIFILFIRLIIKLLSFSRMRKRAMRIPGTELAIYQVDENIIPFSFGNSIFINQNLHSEPELQEIIRHEFIHVKQKHSLDIIWTELLCIVNWYNPFAWLLKKAVRQNLEFIADNKVVEHGINKKEYQYLLLKVIGNNEYSIATQFNFSSLKKRIAMMNKTKSAKRQLLRLLFLLPATAILLLAFRNQWDKVTAVSPKEKLTSTALPVVNISDMRPSMKEVKDTIPQKIKPNKKGYVIYITGKGADCMVSIKDESGKEVKEILLTDWNKDPDHYASLYGEIYPVLAPVEEVLEEGVLNAVVLTPNTNLKLAEALMEVSPLVATTVREVSVEPMTLTGLRSATTLVTDLNVNETMLNSLSPTTVTGVQTMVPLVATMEVPATLAGLSPVQGVLNIGGLTMLDEGQYILVDGKEYQRRTGEKLKGRYTIRFIDKKDAVKKYGDKAQNGAIIAESIKLN
ncbi:MAG: M56 family metallopeptidase [Ferruginibacter sp.]